MKKYGYKKISDMNEFEKSANNDGKHDFSYNSGKHITHQGFIKWGDQNGWGMPGQTKYDVKDLETLLKANEIVSKNP